jgi:hypothetical protein
MDELLGEPCVVGSARRQTRQVVGVAGRPRLPLALDDLEQPLLGSAPGVVGRGGQPGCRVEEDEGTTSFRTSGREEHGERASLGQSEDGRPGGAGGVHDGTDVRDLGLEVGETIQRLGIRHAGSTPIEDDHPPQRSQPPPLAGQLGDLPERLDVMHPALDQHEVQWPLAQDLVREVDFAVPCVLGGGDAVHRAQLGRVLSSTRPVDPRPVRAPATSASDQRPVAATNWKGTSRVESRSGRITPS